MRNGPYELVVAPKNFPGKKYRGRYCYEHTLVWFQHHGRIPSRDEVIHHLNHDKRDNRICNLSLEKRSSHSTGHKKGMVTVGLVCEFCRKHFQRELRNVKSKKKSGQKLFFCSTSCGAKMQQKLGGRIRGPLKVREAAVNRSIHVQVVASEISSKLSR